MSIEPREIAQWTLGMLAGMLLMYMSYLSLLEEFTLDYFVIFGMLVLVALLLYGMDKATKFVEVIRK